ncbi:MAG: radical SAM protein [Prolixibacteraceae bacterium]|jgi:wyosine [tRNA(Phe)-imidazoG37] synthetase (radical SAM superfamily)|nr:radical SAM protein [Prolixibacteraceae bacterium]
MATFLFDKTIFGPLISRRLGISLGVNLLPNDTKLCSFDCIYCECGWNPDRRQQQVHLPKRYDVQIQLKNKLIEMSAESQLPDVITFAGNGEPTMHPDFAAIIDDTIQLRNEFSPKSKIAVLSNATMLHKASVVEALKKVDDNILKLDSGILETILLLNKPVGKFDLTKLTDHLRKFDRALVIQTMFLKGTFEGVPFDNTTEQEIDSWIKLLKLIQPKSVMIYSIARDTPADNLIGIKLQKLEEIGRRVKKETSISVQVSG